MNISEIGNKIFYAGVNNRTAELFEELWPIPNGVSYNSYVVVGDKVALIDTVPACYCIKFLNRIAAIIGDRPIDYLIINHMEPDHSGAIQIIRQKYPNIKIVGNNKTADMIAGYYGITDNLLIIKENDSIDLGAGKSLRFFLTPMVHWPETMMTYLESDAFIFSGDAFGCYGALNGGIVDSDMNTDHYIPEMYRYYSNIVAKYGNMVQAALKKTAPLHIEYICPTHGPVWHDRAAEVVNLYDRMSRFEAEPGVVIAYGSMYGNTEEIVDIIASELTKAGIRNLIIHNLSHSHISQVLADVMRYKGLIIGGPTYSNSLFPPVDALMKALRLRDIRNRSIAFFGSYTWAPAVTKRIEAELEHLKVDVVASPFNMKQAGDSDVDEAARIMARTMAPMVL